MSVGLVNPLESASAMREEACRDAGKAVRVSVSVLSTAGLGSRLAHDKRDFAIAKPVKRAIMASKLPAIWRMWAHESQRAENCGSAPTGGQALDPRNCGTGARLRF